MTDSRWDTFLWDTTEYDESAEGNNHFLQTRLGSVLDARASRLGQKHSLRTIFDSDLGMYSAGYGPAPVHPMHTRLVSDLSASSLSLRHQHQLETLFISSLDAIPPGLTMSHRLVIFYTSSLDASARFRQSHPQSNLFISSLDALATDLDLSHPLTNIFTSELVAMARYIINLPTILPLSVFTPGDPDAGTPGNINLAGNPAPQNDTGFWTAGNGASIALDGSRAWVGTRSIKVEYPAVSNDEYVAALSYGALGIDTWGGSPVWGQMRMAAEEPGTVAAWIQIRYTNGTVLEGEKHTLQPITQDGTSGGKWDLIRAAPLLVPDDGEEIYSVAMLVASENVTPFTIWAGAAQLEYDKFYYGPAPVIETEAA